MATNHERGKDPTPQGRMPRANRPRPHHPIDTGTDEGKYLSSEPGPGVKKDGVWFYGYKKENAYPDNPETQP